MTKINTFLVGAQKAGTTSLYDWLNQHPEIDAPIELKDFHFFSHEDSYKKGISFLEKCYKKNTLINIHSAVNYLFYDKLCAKRIFDYNPNAKIIICLRDPKERAISAYKYFLRTMREKDSFSSALQKELKGELKSYEEISNKTYLSHGYYKEQIKTYLKYFPIEQMCFVFFENLIDKNTQYKEMSKVVNFLKVDNSFNFTFTHLNASGKPKYKIITYLQRKSSITKSFKYFIPFALRKKIAKKIEERNISSKSLEVKILPKDLEFLNAHYEDKNKNLSSIINITEKISWE